MCKRLGLLLLVLVHTFQIILVVSGQAEETSSSVSSPAPVTPNISPSLYFSNLKSTECKDLDPSFAKCAFNSSCIYGESDTVKCHVDDEIPCKGDHTYSVIFPCLYCWQLPESHYTCTGNTTCKANARYLTTCNVNATTYCLGHREFSRYKVCNVSHGHKWSTTMVLSILFGGLGCDRFYLGHWQEGVGKFFSFGGFGVWTLIDTILIYIGYLKPADSSKYE